jgi:chaperonin GroES
MNVKPVGNRIIVKPIDGEWVTKSGIVIATNRPGERNGNAWGEVIALPEHNDNPFLQGIKIGDQVLYKRFQADQSVTMDDNVEFEVIDIEDSKRPGQILAYIPTV